MKNSVKFDPGIGELVVDFNDFVNNVYAQMMSFKTIHQKKARFKLYSSKIERYMKNNISFYAGCLLWGYHIYYSNENSPKEIIGNPMLNLTEEQKQDYDYMIQINFMENYFDSYERDVLYYTGKNYKIPANWRKILSLYSEFIELNNGFTNLKKTSDIKLPPSLGKIKFSFDVEELINKAINEKNIELLSDSYDFTLNS